MGNWAPLQRMVVRRQIAEAFVAATLLPDHHNVARSVPAPPSRGWNAALVTKEGKSGRDRGLQPRAPPGI